ncbi:response regulator, partial [bacterium]|nr:response regulator [bacterium]
MSRFSLDSGHVPWYRRTGAMNDSAGGFTMTTPSRPDGAKVLIAVRDETALNFFQAALGGEGYRLETARTGREALERALSFMPDVVLVDAVLPELSGTALAAKIKGDPTTAPMSVLLVLEQGAADGFAEGLAAGADDFLVKPFTMEVLLARVRSQSRLGQLQVRSRNAVTSHPAGQAERRAQPVTRAAPGPCAQGATHPGAALGGLPSPARRHRMGPAPPGRGG